MSAINQIYTKGSLLKEVNIAGLVRNDVVDGIVTQGQASWVIQKLIEETNRKFESNGTGNKILTTYKTEVAYEGDPTIKGQISSVATLSGGLVQINFSDSNLNSFRNDDNVDLKWNGNQARVVEAGQGFIKVGQAQGFTAPVAGDFTAGKLLIARTRAIGMRGTKSPAGLNPVPNVRYNYCSIIDDANQTNVFDSLNQTVLSQATDYISIAGVKKMLQRFFNYQTQTMFTSKAVDPSSNGFTFSAASGIDEQISVGGNTYTMNTALTKADLISKLRMWMVSNIGSDPKNRVILTGSIGFQQISDFFQELIKYDGQIALSFTDGTSINGLNATRIFVPGFEMLQFVKWPMLDLDSQGERSSLPGFTNLPKTSGDFYCLDFTPVTYETSGMMGPAFQKYYFKSKYFYAYNQGIVAMDSLGTSLTNAQPLTEENLQITSTDADFSNFRVVSACGMNVMNPTAHMILRNNA
jgi:hypothetical protein